ncbi:hypothetical protein RRG08_032767 [Elysia crispata]|uniref:Uncharacterized protein n=1 Tax=Elysia crispata TaxID=231223 RepID=A0AAE0YPN7_9GAST|nr:hypothetical protein RRG08_032767 [Elysia crispata]
MCENPHTGNLQGHGSTRVHGNLLFVEKSMSGHGTERSEKKTQRDTVSLKEAIKLAAATRLSSAVYTSHQTIIRDQRD